MKQGANALSQCGVFLEEPLECLTDSVYLGPEGSRGLSSWRGLPALPVFQA